MLILYFTEIIIQQNHFNFNPPFTHCVGIDKEKGLRKALAQKWCFASRFYSFVFYCQFHTFFKSIAETVFL